MTRADVERMIAAISLSERDERAARDMCGRLGDIMCGEIDAVTGSTDDPVMVAQAALAMALAAGEVAIAKIRARRGRH